MYDQEIGRVEELVTQLQAGDLTEIAEEDRVNPATFKFPGLTDKENLVVIARGACLTLDDIAEQLATTHERVRHLEGNALQKLRHPTRFNLRPVIHQLNLCEMVYSCCICGLR
jgi:DNA-directed RNA polymerase sigma subunit (sigma70/sigma32)